VEIAVVLPAFQAASTLGLTLASVAGQELPAREVVVVDDCSTDGTADVVAQWSHLLPLRVVRHERNMGLAAAIRTGVAAARPRTVARLDADDIWFPDHLTTLAALYERNGGLVAGNCWSWVPGRALAGRSWFEKHPVAPPGEELVTLARHNWIVGAVMFGRSDYDRVGGIRDLPSCEDWDLWLRMLDAGVPVTAAPNVTMLYRQGVRTMSKGEKALRAGAALLKDFAATGRDPRAREAALRTAREMERGAHLHRSYGLVRDGSSWAARASAVRALGGVPRTSARAAAVLLAPGASVRLYDRLQSDASRRVDA